MPRRPTGSSPTPSAARSPSAAPSSSLDRRTGGAERAPRPHAHVGAGDHGDGPVAGAAAPARRGRRRRATSRARPAPRSRTSSALARRPRARHPPTRWSSRSAASSHTANTAVRRRSAPGPVSAPRPVPEQAPEARGRAAGAARSVAEAGQRGQRRGRGARGGTTRPRPCDMLAPCVAGCGSPCRSTAGYLLGSIPTAVIVGRRRDVDLRRVGDRNPGYWNAKEDARPPRRAAGARRRHRQGRRPARRSAGPSPGAASGGPGTSAGGGDGRPRLAGVRRVPGRARRGHVRRAAGVVAPAAAAVVDRRRRRWPGATSRSAARGIRVGFAVLPARPARRRGSAPDGRDGRAHVARRPALLDGGRGDPPAPGAWRRRRVERTSAATATTSAGGDSQ